MVSLRYVSLLPKPESNRRPSLLSVSLSECFVGSSPLASLAYLMFLRVTREQMVDCPLQITKGDITEMPCGRSRLGIFFS